jgi:hypothetical protein
MKTRIAHLALAIVVTLSTLAAVALASPQPVRACDVGCGGIIGVFSAPKTGTTTLRVK